MKRSWVGLAVSMRYGLLCAKVGNVPQALLLKYRSLCREKAVAPPRRVPLNLPEPRVLLARILLIERAGDDPNSSLAGS